jgi:hypothetical protein
MKEVSENEFWVYHGILIAASLFRRGGLSLWPEPVAYTIRHHEDHVDKTGFLSIHDD